MLPLLVVNNGCHTCNPEMEGYGMKGCSSIQPYILLLLFQTQLF